MSWGHSVRPERSEAESKGPAPQPPKPSFLASLRRPDLWRRGDFTWPVSFPRYVLPGGPFPTTIDQVAGCAIALCYAGASAAARIVDVRTDGYYRPVDPVLASRVFTAAHETRDYRRDLSEILAPTCELGLPMLEPLYRAAAAREVLDPPTPRNPAHAKILRLRLAAADPAHRLPTDTEDPEGWLPHYPIPIHPAWHHAAPAYFHTAGDAPVFQWATASCGDFLGLPEHPDPTPAMLRFVGILNALHPIFNRLVHLYDSEGPQHLDPRLALQVCAAVGELTFHSAQTAYQVREDAKEGFAEEKTRLEALAKRQANNDANLIVLGERHRPALYTKIGSQAVSDGRCEKAAFPRATRCQRNRTLRLLETYLTRSRDLRRHSPYLRAGSRPRSPCAPPWRSPSAPRWPRRPTPSAASLSRRPMPNCTTTHPR